MRIVKLTCITSSLALIIVGASALGAAVYLAQIADGLGRRRS